MNILAKIDIYGYAVGVSYRGNATMQTRLGGIVSLITYVLALTNLLTLVEQLLDHSEQVVNFRSVKAETLEMDLLNLQENEIVFGVYTEFPIPSSIGRWVGVQKNNTNHSELIEVSRE